MRVPLGSLRAGAKTARDPLGPGGYPTSYSRESLQDAKMQVEELRKATREMRAAEAQLKWGMKREEEKTRRAEKHADDKDVLMFRRTHRNQAARHHESEHKARKEQEISDSRDYQEFKRMQTNQKNEDAQQCIREAYLESKEHSEWHAQLGREVHAEQPRPIIEANIEKHQTIREYKQAERLYEEQEAVDVRTAAEQADLQHKMSQLLRDRELAMHSLERTRMNQKVPIPSGQHLSARPM